MGLYYYITTFYWEHIAVFQIDCIIVLLSIKNSALTLKKKRGKKKIPECIKLHILSQIYWCLFTCPAHQFEIFSLLSDVFLWNPCFWIFDLLIWIFVKRKKKKSQSVTGHIWFCCHVFIGTLVLLHSISSI